MLKKTIILLLLALSINFAYALDVKCGFKNFYGTCIMGEACNCEISDCQSGTLFVFSSDITNPLCIPPIKDSKASIDLIECNSNILPKINAVAVCGDETSNQISIDVLEERPPACVWNEEELKCEANSDPLAEKCQSGYSCSQIEEGVCKCLKPNATTTMATTTATTQIPIVMTTASAITTIETQATTTTVKLSECPYECCKGLEGYEDLTCKQGYVCCESDDGFICKKGSSCFEEAKKPSGFAGWIIILIVIGLSVVAGAVYYFSKTRVNLQDKYRL